MGKMDKLGYELYPSPFDDWIVYYNRNKGVIIRFMNDTETIYIDGELHITMKLLDTIKETTIKLGWEE